MALDLTNEVVIRWSDPDPRHAQLLRQGGITVAWGDLPAAARAACSAVGIRTLPADAIRTLGSDALDRATPGGPVGVTTGLWPGVRGRDPDVASATRSLWVDANAFRVAHLRALYPRRTLLLAYLPDTAAGVTPDRVVPYETLELALAEAWAAGGNYILALEPKYWEALRAGDGPAMDAWRSLGRTARWLGEHARLFRQPALPIVTVLVDQGFVSTEIANLMFRQSVSPALEPAADPPAPSPTRRVVVAAGIDAPPPPVASRILAHAHAGSIVVVDDTADTAWWRTGSLSHIKSQEDREFYALGRGQVVAYHQVGDPGELALDVLDLVTRDRRPARLWNCPGGVPLATSAPETGTIHGRALLHVLNYSRPVDLPVLARIHGNFERATVLRPDAPPVDVHVARRGPNSEVSIPQLARIAVVVFR